jgi:hypothetical protein
MGKNSRRRRKINKANQSAQKKHNATHKENAPKPPVRDLSGFSEDPFDLQPTPPYQIHVHCPNNEDDKLEKKLEIAGFILALIVAIILGFQGYEMLKATKAAEGQISEIQEDRNLDERAWVTESHVGIEQSQIGDSVYFKLTYENTGRTPALNVESMIGATTSRTNINEQDKFPDPPLNAGIVRPGGSGFCFTDPIPIANVQSIYKGSSSYVYGTIWYDDIFGKHHWSQYCLQTTSKHAGVLEFNYTPFHNSCDDVKSNHTN